MVELSELLYFATHFATQGRSVIPYKSMINNKKIFSILLCGASPVRHFPLFKNKYVRAGRDFLFISKGLSDPQGAAEHETLDDFRLKCGFVSKAPNLSNFGTVAQLIINTMSWRNFGLTSCYV